MTSTMLPRKADSADVATETTPLLSAAAPVLPTTNTTIDGNVSPNTQPSEDSMPVVQVLLLCYSALAEPVAYFSIFPFINEMLERNGDLPEEEVGYWSGAIESLFSLVQMVLMIFYGRMADRVGRKPVLVFSLAGVSVATALFGLSKSVWQMIAMRCLAGVFAGSVVTIRTMLSEITNKKTQGRAFSWYMFARNFGILIGPLIGGGLSSPADQFPNLFGRVQFCIDYPYALSSFAAGAVALSGTLSCLFFLDETLKRRLPGTDAAEAPLSTWEVVKSPGVGTVLSLFGHIMLLSLSYTAILPVAMFTRVGLGGFSFTPQQISYFFAIIGASQSLWILLVFPPLQKLLGTARLLRICTFIWAMFMALYPLENELLRYGYETAFWIIAPAGLVICSSVAMSFACVQLCLNDISPSPSVLGTVNAVALTVSSAVRAVAPAAATSLYAWGLKIQWADGHLAWFVLIALSLLLNYPVYYIPEAAQGRPEQQEPKQKKLDEVEGDDGDDESGRPRSRNE